MTPVELSIIEKRIKESEKAKKDILNLNMPDTEEIVRAIQHRISEIKSLSIEINKAFENRINEIPKESEKNPNAIYELQQIQEKIAGEKQK